MRQSEEEP